MTDDECRVLVENASGLLACKVSNNRSVEKHDTRLGAQVHGTALATRLVELEQRVLNVRVGRKLSQRHQVLLGIRRLKVQRAAGLGIVVA